MAKAKTGLFYIRATIDVDTSETPQQEDLSVYVDPVNRQGLLIRQVDFIWHDKATFLPMQPSADWEAVIQIHDTTLGALVAFENPHQVASASLVSVNASATEANQDFFPDRLGMGKGEGRIVVNDSLEIVTDGSASVPANLAVTMILECQVVTLSQKDYISLALQSVADN
jgi:hypothetical protein